MTSEIRMVTYYQGIC